MSQAIHRNVAASQTSNPRKSKIYLLLKICLCALAAKVLVSIVKEYPSYFPADFNSAFLTGREAFFHSWYRAAFYCHIIAGPITVLLAGFLFFSGQRLKWRKTHRTAGKIQVALILAVIMPTGLAMSLRAYTGHIAGMGFAMQSAAVGACAWMTMSTARQGRIAAHRQWATRCNLILVSPLILRVFSGWMIVTQFESVRTYQASAWLAWIIPLMVYECRLRRGQTG